MEAPKEYRLFKLFCLKDLVFSALMSKAKCPIPILTGRGKRQKRIVQSDLIMPTYPDTEIMIDDISLSNVVFKGRFDTRHV